MPSTPDDVQVDRSEWDKIWQIGRGGLAVCRAKVGELWPRRSPCAQKILKSVKENCVAFVVHSLAEHDEIWQHQSGQSHIFPEFG